MNLVRKIASNYKLPYYTISPTYSICQDHGYITGEVYTCPTCGKKTEVWSRITGYYRPVQNWNNGKSQEFKDRKEYVLGSAVAEDARKVIQPVQAAKEEVEKVEEKVISGGKLLLFTTKTCPNCRQAEKMLNEKGIKFEQIDASENEDLVNKYNVMAAPTLVITDGDSTNIYKGIVDVQKYIAAH